MSDEITKKIHFVPRYSLRHQESDVVGEWLKANWKPVGGVLLVVAIYALSYFPGLAKEHDLLVMIGAITGTLTTAFIPSFVKAKE